VLAHVSITAVIHLMREWWWEAMTTRVENAGDLGVDLDPREGCDITGGWVHSEHDRREK
jgi:hypothetical protein